MPLARTTSVALCPDVTDCGAGCEVIDGGTTGGGGDVEGVVLEILTIAVDEFTEPAAFHTRTQNDDVTVRTGVRKSLPVAPDTGTDVSPLAPDTTDTPSSRLR